MQGACRGYVGWALITLKPLLQTIPETFTMVLSNVFLCGVVLCSDPSWDSDYRETFFF